MADAIIWWITLQLLGLIALPVAAVLLRSLPDRGYAMAKILGLLLVGWLGYTIAMTGILPFGRGLLAGCALAVAALSAGLLVRNGGSLRHELVARFRIPSYRRYVITAEVLFALAYIIWAVVRAYNPDIVDQEKFMDFGFLNAILKSPTFPPNDMWFAGQSINYYYFGYVLIAALTSLSGVATAVAFNLANVTLYALTALGAFGLVYNLIAGTALREQPPAKGARAALAATRNPRFLSPYLFAVLAALMIVAMGNLTTVFAQHAGDTTEGNGWRFCFMCQSPAAYDWFAPSRIIQDYQTTSTPGGGVQKQKVGFETINEFPAFSFLLADMHPHVLALPLVLLVVAIGLAFARRRPRPGIGWRAVLPLDLDGWLALGLAGLAVGALYTTNTWDYPTYLLVVVGGLGLAYLATQRRSEQPAGWGWLGPWLLQSLLLVVLSLLLFLPFHLTFKSIVGGQAGPLDPNLAGIPVLGVLLQKLSSLLIVNTADKTILGFLVIFGISLLAIAGWLVYEFSASLRRRIAAGDPPTRLGTAWGAFAVVVAVAAFAFKFPLLALLLPLAVVAGALIWREPARAERNLALLLVALAALIALGVEVVFLRDNFQMRMNTLFKFYYQVWVLWGLAGAYGLWRVLDAAYGLRAAARSRAAGAPPPRWRAFAAAWAGVTGLLVLSGLLYSVYGPLARQIGSQAGPRGLDGTAWLQAAVPGDAAAIRWLDANAGGSDVVLETGADEYQHVGRVSSYTGVPTLIAWDNSHESLWRGGQPALQAQIAVRRQVVDSIYQGTDPQNGSPLTAARLLELLHQYKVDYVFAGASERGVPGWAPSRANETLTSYAEGVFEQALPVAFRSASTVVYAVQAGIAGTGVAPAPPAAAAGTPAPANAGDANAPPVDLFAPSGSAVRPAGSNRGQFTLPRGIARDAAGDFYVVDTQNMRVEKFDPAGKFLTVFGSKGQAPGQFAPYDDKSQGAGPGGIAVDKDGNVYVADTWNHRIEKFDPQGAFLATWGSFISLSDPAAAADPDKDRKFYGPRGIAAGPDGHIYVTDTGNKRVVIFDAAGAYVRQISSGVSPTRTAPGYAFSAPGELNEPIGVAVDGGGNVYVADSRNARIQKFSSAGAPVAQWPVPAGAWDPGPYLEPFLALDKDGNVYATAPTSKSVLKWSPAGKLLGQKSAQGATTLARPTGLTVGADGTVYVVDTEANTVVNLGRIP